MAVQDGDMLIVNRGGIDHKVTASDLDDKLQDTDEVLINRGGTDYKVSGADLRQYLGIEKMPWDDATGIYHVIISDPADILVAPSYTIYNKDTKAEVSSIDAPGEYIITSGTNSDGLFWESPGNWDFGDLTDTSKVTRMSNMFLDCKNFNSDLSMFDTSSVEKINTMFSGCEAFNQDISHFDVSNVWTFYSTFYGTKAFNQDISNWDTSSATIMKFMFYTAEAFNQDLSKWCVDPEPDHLNFDYGTKAWTEDRPCWGHCPRGENGSPNPCPGPPWEDELNWFHIIPEAGQAIQIPWLSNGVELFPGISEETVQARKLYKIDGEFLGQLYRLNGRPDISELNSSDEYIITTNEDASNLLRDQKRGKFKFGPLTNSSKVKAMQDLFSHNWRTTDVNIRYVDTSSCERFSYMFYNCPLYNEQEIENLDTSNAKQMIGMCGYDPSHIDNPHGSSLGALNRDLSAWCVQGIRISPHEFLKNQPIETDTSKQPCWGHCLPNGDPCPPPPKPPWEDAVGIYHVIVFNPADINVGSADSIYNKDSWDEVPSIDFPGEYIITTGEDSSSLFVDSPGSLYFGALTDTSNVTNMESMFSGCEAFNSDIGNWDTSNVTNMDEMFRGARTFNQDLSEWCVNPEPDHLNFDRRADAWGNKNKPVWRTCPRGENKP